MSEKKQTVLGQSRIISIAKICRSTFALISLLVINILAESLSGYVFDLSRNAQSGIIIELFTVDAPLSSYIDTTDSKGMYSIDNFLPQQYQIRLSSGSFPEQWVSSSGNSIFRQDYIYLSATQDFSITYSPLDYLPSSALEITFLDSSGQPVKDCYANVYLESYPDGKFIKQISTTNSNIAVLSEIYSSSYAIKFYVSSYPEQYYDPNGNTSFANNIVYLEKDDTLKITTQLTTHPRIKGRISGYCQTKDGLPAADVTVLLYDIADTSKAINTFSMGTEGKFWFDYLQAGKYYLKATESGYPDQWLSRNNLNTTFPDDIFEISALTNNIDCYLIMTMSPLDTVPTAGVSVILLDQLRNTFMRTASVELIQADLKKKTYLTFDALKSTFTASNIPAGKYELLVTADGYPTQYYSPDGNTDVQFYTFDLIENEIKPIEVILTTDLSNPQNFTGNLIGYVSGENVGIGGVSLHIYNGAGVDQNIITDTYGKFSLKLPNSQYYLVIENSTYPFEYWSVNGTVLDKSARTIISVYAGETTDLFIELKKTGEQVVNQYIISGSVLDKATSKPVKNCRVLLLENQNVNTEFNFKNLWPTNVTWTDDSGHYSFSGISEGEYIIAAESDTNNYVAQFHNNTDLLSEATAIRVLPSSVISGVNFNLRTGGIIKGYVKDNTGIPLDGVSIFIHQKSQGGRYYQTNSAADGCFEVRGIPAGDWYVLASDPNYIWLNNSIPEFSISEGSITNVNTFTFEAGGSLSGSFTFNPDDRYIYNINNNGRFLLYNEFATDTHSIIAPVYSTDAFLSLSTVEYTGFVKSGACKTGKWKVIFSPGPQSTRFNIPDTAAFISGLRYSVVDNLQEILPLKNTENISFKMEKGYSVFGKVVYNNLAISGNFNINAYVKIGDKYVLITNSYLTNSGQFELPGFVQGEKYYLQVWADGFSPQFWSPSGNSLYPDQPYVFDTSSYVPMTIVLNDKINSGDNNDNRVISLWQEKTTDGRNILKWNVNASYQLDTFFVYASKLDYSLALLTKIIAGNTAYSYQDSRTLESLTRYVIVGKGRNNTARSNIIFCFPGSYYSSTAQAWINVFNKRDQIIVEWGSADSIRYSETDSVCLFRRIDGGNWSLQERRSAYERQLIDWKWTRADSGKTFEYKIELKSGSIVSASRSIKIDNNVLSQLSANIVVGTYEKCKTIQQAIDVANDFDNIYVKSGTYAERLDFKGKIISIHGSWEFGKPPVLDASGGIAVTIPFNDKYCGSEFTRIEGFKIQNATAGIMAASNVDINNCLFVNVTRAIISQNDSSKLSVAFIKNPFFSNEIRVNASQCTFIGRSKGDLIAEALDLGVTSSNTTIQAIGEFYYSEISISRSIFYQYFSKALQTTLPVRNNGILSRIRIQNCDIWETSTQIVTSNAFIENIKGINPEFTDTLNYFLSEKSALRSENIGYGSGIYNEEMNRPSAVKNLKIRILSMNSIGLSWDTPAINEKIAYYKIYRVPGDTSLFYVNEKMQWDLRIPKDSIEKMIPVFVTNKNYYVDTSIVSGMPYVYAVAAMDSSGRDGQVNLSAPPPITEYMVNLYTNKMKISGQKWYMLSPWGENIIKTPSTASVFHWDDKSTGSPLLSQYLQCSQIQPGDGYWVKSLTDTVFEIPSGSLSVLRQSQDSLKCHLVKGVTGWNQIGSPFPFPIYPSWLNSIPVWEWNPDSMGYSRAHCLKPWIGYWAYVEKDTSLLLLNKTWPSVYTNNLAKRLKNIDWELNLSLSGKSAWDPENRIGVTSANLSKTDDFNTPEPPLAFGASQLYLLESSALTSDFTENNNKLSDLYKNGSEKNLEWLVAVSSSEYKSRIEVQGINSLPEEIHLFWINGNNIQDLKKSNQIVIEPHENTQYGYIIATSDLGKIANYRRSFYLRNPYPNPFRSSAKIEYFIPYQFMENGIREDANGTRIQLTVYNLVGKKVKTLVNGVANPGFHCIVWNGTTDNMQRVSAGFYIVRLQSQNFVKTVKLFRIN